MVKSFPKYYPSILLILLTFELPAISTISQTTKISKKLKVTKRQDEYNLIISQINRPTNTDPVCVSEVTTAQGWLLDDLSKIVSSLKMSAEQLPEQIYVNKRDLDDLDQCSRSNCLILHGYSNLPNKKASNLALENFVLKPLN